MRIERIYHKAIPAWTEEVKIYEYDELSEEVKQELREAKARDLDISDFWVCEWGEAVKEIAKLLNAKYDYSIGYCDYNNHLNFVRYDEPEEEVMGVRAYKWIFNNWIKYAYKPKLYYKKWEKQRKSKIKFSIDNCPFTGICYDCNFSEAWKEFSADIKAGKQLTVSDFVEMLEDKLQHDIVSEIDYRYSEEGLDEELSFNEYYEDGEIAS
jgi:hypothetical protein